MTSKKINTKERFKEIYDLLYFYLHYSSRIQKFGNQKLIKINTINI
jgi:hypothetical protein